MCNFYKVLLFVFLVNCDLYSQTITGKKEVCVNDIVGFNFFPSTSSLVIDSIRWSFGDNNNSSVTSPIHYYKTAGTFTVTANAYLNNSTTQSATHTITVYGLPNISFIKMDMGDSCITKTPFCLVDKSTPHSNSQTIIKSMIIWGDGNKKDNNNRYYNQQTCYSYRTGGKYKYFIEITDDKGCKKSLSDSVVVKDGIRSNFDVNVIYNTCSTAQICVKNTSTFLRKYASSFEWKMDTLNIDTNRHISPNFCFTVNRTKIYDIKLKAKISNGCNDELYRKVFVDLSKLTGEIELEDSVVCYGKADGKLKITLKNHNAHSTQLFHDNKFVGQMDFGVQTIDLKTIDTDIGKHKIKVILRRGNCIDSILKEYRIIGPKAGFQLYRFEDCLLEGKEIIGVANQPFNPNTTKFSWNIGDPYGDNCISERSKKINTNLFCNYAKDSFFVHKLRKDLDFLYVTLNVKDTLTGCEDFADSLIISRCCRLCRLNIENIDVCLGENIFNDQPNENQPDSISLDGMNSWYKYPANSRIFGVGEFNVHALYLEHYRRVPIMANDTSLIFVTDTIFRDTIAFPFKLRIHNLRSNQISHQIYGKCAPYTVVLKFKDSMFYTGESIHIEWGDMNKTDLFISNNKIIDSIVHIYNTNSVNSSIDVKIKTNAYCESDYKIKVKLGNSISANFSPSICLNKENCFIPRIFDNVNNKYWKGNNYPNYGVVWLKEDGSVLDTSFNFCQTPTTFGNYKVGLSIIDQNGCKDSLFMTYTVNGVKAATKKLPDAIYCSEFTQFFDSSYFINDTNDFIKKYVWDFGSKKYDILLKNPSLAFDLSQDTLFIFHAVESNKGCKDTLKTAVPFIGAMPYFDIKDTVGCEKLKGVFYNNSKNVMNYFWEFGDQNGTILNTDIKDSMIFNYNLPGTYHIKLRGVRSVVNPINGATYFCNSIFPDPVFQREIRRTVHVLPRIQTYILSKDTICRGDSALFELKSDSSLYSVNWNYLEQNKNTINNHLISSIFDKDGTYLIKAIPEKATNKFQHQCADSAQKNIVVVSVKADFEFSDIAIPSIKFNNLSTPLSLTQFEWDFGENATPNSSTQTHPVTIYRNLKEENLICLTAKLPQGCQDSICKPLGIYDEFLLVFNVFTPNGKDDYNEEYEILIDGEEKYELYIYDRWGILVFKSYEDNYNWNGTLFNKGNECPEGTYYYIFKYTMKTKPKDEKIINGVITLLR